MHRRGERIGWIGGGLGGFLWLPIVAVAWMLQGRTYEGMLAVAFFVAGVAAVFFFAPWRHPKIGFRCLLAPVLALLAVGGGVCVWLESVKMRTSLGWESLLLLIPVLLPLWTAKNVSWEDGEPRQDDPKA